MRIDFHKVRYTNFLSSGPMGNEIQLDAALLTKIVGTNGAGKSTIIDAIIFALYGVAYRDTVKNGLVNWLSGEGALVELDLSLNGKPCVIRRGISPDIFEVTIAGKAMPRQKSVRDTQAYFEQHVLGVSQKAFCQNVILGKTGYTPFMSLTAAQRRAVVEDLLDIEVFSRMSEALKQRVSEAKSVYTAAQTDVKIAENKLQVLQEQDERAGRNVEAEIARAEAERDEIAQQVAKMEVPEPADVAQLDKLMKAHSRLVKDRTKHETHIDSAKRELKKLDGAEACPVCGQEITEEHKTRESERLQAQITKSESFIAKTESPLDQIEQDIAEIERIDRAYKRAVGTRESLQWQVKNLEKNIERARQQAKEIRPDKGPVERELRAAESALSTATEQLDLMVTANRLLKDDGIKASVVRRYLPMLNRGINAYVHAFDLPLTFSFDETFDESVTPRFVQGARYGNLSEGEKARVELAVLLCWRDVARERASIDTNLLLLDEVLDASLDQTGCVHLMKFLKRSGSNVIVISHRDDDEVDDAFDRTLCVSRLGDFSHVAEVDQ